MTITLRVQRYNPETDDAPRFQDYELDVAPTDRVLDALVYVQARLDGTLALRKSCAHGICGSDAMVINGTERLACKTFIRDVAGRDGDVVTIEPLRGMPVQRDLCVDQSAFFGKYRAVKPYLIASRAPAEKELRQSPEDRVKFEDQTKCILCSACYSSCPVTRETNPAFIGPAAAVQASRFLLDSRDTGFDERRETLDAPDGVWACAGHFNCTRVCPRGIKVTKIINHLKRQIRSAGESSH